MCGEEGGGGCGMVLDKGWHGCWRLVGGDKRMYVGFLGYAQSWSITSV